jgi:hypothetical protein
MDFSLIEKAELTQKEFGRLCGVSRVTANLWATKKFAPHRYIQARVKDNLTAIAAAIEAGLLPLPNNVERDSRYDALTRVIEQTRATAA